MNKVVKFLKNIFKYIPIAPKSELHEIKERKVDKYSKKALKKLYKTMKIRYMCGYADWTIYEYEEEWSKFRFNDWDVRYSVKRLLIENGYDVYENVVECYFGDEYKSFTINLQ